jgi:uncharacterized protein (TIGR03067 family)
MQVQLVLTLAVSFLAAPVPKDEAKDAQAIQGTWVVVSAESNGKPMDDIKGEKLILKDGKVTMTTKNKEEKGTYKIDPMKKPKTIDLTEEGKTEPSPGIYTLEGDTLKLCVSSKPGARPTEFSGKAENHLLIVLKRRKK